MPGNFLKIKMPYYTVHIKPSGYNLIVKAGETVLYAALRQGYQFPHECVAGDCGTCRGQLLEGHVEYDEEYLPGLNDDEREAGYALFCSAKPISDLVIHVDGVIGPAQLPTKKLTYDVASCEKIGKYIYKVILQPPAEGIIEYCAGQYVEILQRDASPLPYSITNAPLSDDNHLELHIRHLPDHQETGELIKHIQIEQKIRLQGPFGSCILKQEPPYPIIFLAGGTGFAPHKALIEQALAEGIEQTIYLYWGARTLSDLYFHEQALRWAKHMPNFHYIPVLSEPTQNDHWAGRTGLVHEAVLEDHANLSHFHVYASGPYEMVYAALHVFQNLGLKRAFFYSDMLDYSTEK